MHLISKKMLCLLAILVTLAFAAPALGELAPYGYVTSHGLHLREQPSEDAVVLTTCAERSWLTILQEEPDNIWLKVLTANGQEGYVNSKYVEQDSAGIDNPGVVSNEGKFVNLHDRPDQSALVMQQVPDGSDVAILGQEYGWYKIQFEGTEGYVLASMVSTHLKPVAHKYVHSGNGGNVNLRSGPTTLAEPLTSLAAGTEVDVLIAGSDWDKVRARGRIGYIVARYLDDNDGDEQVPVSYKYGYVNTNHATTSLRLRQSPNTAAIVLGNYPNGTKVKILNEGSQWDEVTVDGQHGYMNAQFISHTKHTHYDDGGDGDNNGAAQYNSDGFMAATLINPNGGDIVYFRASPSMDAEIIASQQVGLQAQVYSKGRDWCKVRLGGEWGYVSTHFLRFQ